MVVEVSWCPDSLADVCGHLYRWQTLAGGLAPLFAGYLAFKSVRDQTSVLQKEALDRRLRLTRSFRAGLSEDAANIGRYCRDCARIQISVLKRHADEEAGRKVAPGPQTEVFAVPRKQTAR